MKTKSLTIALLAAGIITITTTASAVTWNPAEWFKKAPSAGQTTTQVAPATALPAVPIGPIGPMTAPNYRAIVERYGSAVVGINTQGMSKTSMEGSDGAGADDPYFKFFRGMPGFGGQDGHAPRGGEVPVRGLGSGFIVSHDGVILTNAHVVRDADEVIVKLSDRREYKAKVLGSDKATDVAVLKIDAGNLPVVSLGNPSQLGVGDYVLAIGSPFGFEQSATAGIVSAKGRSLPGDAYVPFIQTDVAVNPGNSGGPLFDASGAVIGINSQIYSKTGGYQGVSFAIPINVALQVKDQIMKTGKAEHARLGVTIQELSPSLAESFGLTRPDGALVSSVTPGSAADNAGIKPGDVILKYNTQPIARSGDLPTLVGLGVPGDKATLEVWRGGKKIDLATTLTEAKDITVAGSNSEKGARQARLGVAVRPLTAEEQQGAHLESGVVVEQVAGAAAKAGIEAGDVIVSVNGTSVRSVEQLQTLVKKESKHLAVLIQRGDERIFIPVALG
ncbi:Do family serine endopeptidase [Actimicrobium antarcticum]|uniref:Probable periplasmic serine endoprotease DegP-like n=1 Tax=Actimicrobium antarcticum TaxID=1051899 RepID=A0ABP7SZU7_9BURK